MEEKKMPKNTRWIICFDFETDGKDPTVANPTELAAVPIDPETLEIRKDLAFETVIKPPGIDKDDYFTDARNDTIAFHAKMQECTPDEVIEKWKKGIPQKTAWKNFSNYCAKYNVDKRPGQWYGEPISAGMNIIGYDLPICRRLCKKYKTKMPISDVAIFDLYHILQLWFESLSEPQDLKMDTLKKFLGIKDKDYGQAHAALPDTLVTAEIITRFMKFIRRQSSVEKFKGSFAK